MSARSNVVADPRPPRLPAEGSVLSARGVGVRVGSAQLVSDVDLDVASGEVVAVVGPNGAGKSTLVGALSGDRTPSGTVTIDGLDVARTPARILARHRSVMAQRTTVAFGFTVREVVAMGRAPWHRTEQADLDEALVDWALGAATVDHLAERSVTTLSGGELARVVLARTLVQDAPVVFLDEPTAALDPPHVARVLGLVRQRAAAGDAVVVVIHDLSAAAAHADRVVLMVDGRVVADGGPAEVITAPVLSAAYDHPMDVVTHPRTGAPIVVPGPHTP